MSEKVIEKLAVLLADSVVLYVKTQGFHWNVTGPHFAEYHALFQTQYTDLAAAIDEIAERIRSLGDFPPAGLAAFQQLSVLKDCAANKTPPSADAMLKELLADHETIAKSAKAALDAAEAVGDDVTVDLMTERRAVHGKTAWMLRATLGQG